MSALAAFLVALLCALVGCADPAPAGSDRPVVTTMVPMTATGTTAAPEAAPEAHGPVELPETTTIPAAIAERPYDPATDNCHYQTEGC